MDRQTYTTRQEKVWKMLHKYWKSQFLIASHHFSIVLLWRQLQWDFLRFTNWTRPSGWCGNFYRVVQGQHPLLCALWAAESLSCPKSIGSIGDITIFQGQQYSSCSKAGGCRAAQLPRGFRRNLLIVSWATPTPECEANFPESWCIQQLILRPFGRSGQELPAGYQVEARFINFSVSTAKKAVDRGQDLGIWGNPASKQRFHSNSTGTKIIRKSLRKNPTFYVFAPCLFWDRIWIRLRIRGRLVTEFCKKKSKLTKL
jgi:hypothetical protein